MKSLLIISVAAVLLMLAGCAPYPYYGYDYYPDYYSGYNYPYYYSYPYYGPYYYPYYYPNFSLEYWSFGRHHGYGFGLW